MVQVADTAQAAGADAPPKMHKSIRLRVTLKIEGDDEPAHDFAAATAQAVRDVIAAGSKTHPELQITIKGIAEQSG